MKTKKFVEAVEALGFVVVKEQYGFNIEDAKCGYVKDDYLFFISETSQEIHIGENVYIGTEKRIALLKLISEYLDTQITEREEEKRYWLRIVANLGFKDNQRFLNLNIEREEYFICSARQSEWVQTIFTESEIAEMDITGFQKVEVTE